VDATHRCLVVENSTDADARRLGDWLTAAGLELDVVRAQDGDPVPTEPTGYAAVVVLGGDQHVYPGPDGEPGAPWFADIETLLRRSVRANVPTLGICLGAQLLASAHAGTVEPAVAGPEIGAELVAKRDLADRDPLFAALPMLPDVIQWHRDEVSELPHGAVLLAASPRCPNQAFRIGGRAWGVQFHIECDPAMIRDWAGADGPLLDALELEAGDIIAGVEAIVDDLAETWQPFAERFAALARGELDSSAVGLGPGVVAGPGLAGGPVAAPPGRELPLLGH
jgi:GMP synthase-like glutamine amidotransferase